MLLSGCTGTSRGETLAVVFVTYRQPYDFLYSLSLSLSLCFGLREVTGKLKNVKSYK